MHDGLWLEGMVLIVALGVVLGAHEFQPHTLVQVSDALVVPLSAAAQVNLVSWITFFAGGALFGLLHMMATPAKDAEKPSAILEKKAVGAAMLGFVMWGCCIVALAKATFTLETLYAVTAVASLGAGVFAASAFYMTIHNIQPLQIVKGSMFMPQRIQLFLLFAAPDFFKMLVIAANGPPPYTGSFHESYLPLMPIVALVGLFMLFYTSGAIVREIPMSMSAIRAKVKDFRVRGPAATLVEAPTVVTNVIDNKEEKGSLFFFCVSAFLFSVAYSLHDVYGPLWLQTSTFETPEYNPAYVGWIMIPLGSVIGKFLGAMTAEWSVTETYTMTANYLGTTACAIVSIACMIAYSVQLAGTTGDQPYLVSMILYFGMQVGLGVMFMDFVYSAIVYYGKRTLGLPPTMALMLMLLMMIPGPAVGFADSIRGGELDVNDNPIINYTTVSYAVVGFFSASCVVNALSKVLKDGSK